MYNPNPSQEWASTFSPSPACPSVGELKYAKYQFRVENTEFEIPNLRYIGFVSESIVFKTEGL